MDRPSFSIYDASAGSGKTYNLVKEYLKIILTAENNDAYRTILAITFTNKAVHEMKSRIVDNLSAFANDNPTEKVVKLMQDLSIETKLSLAAIKIKSQQIIKHIIHNYAAFDISTIDKFTHRVIRAFAHDLGLPMTFEVSLESDNLLVEAVDALIAKAGEDAVLTKLLVDFTMEKTDDDKSWDISREIYTTGKLILNENNRTEIAHFENKKIEDFIQIKSKLIEAIKVLENENAALGNKILYQLESNNIDEKSFSYGTFPNHISYIIDGDERVNKYKFIAIEEVKIKKDSRDIDLIYCLLPEILNLLQIAYKNNEKKDFYTAFLKNITPLSLLNTVSKELKTIQDEQNILSITEFNTLIYNEIQNQPTPFIYEKLGERYRHFFIDEFQDTSEMQWKNLIPLIDNATSSMQNNQKGTLMIVGDPKQSIYRWRGGKAEQFIELSKKTDSKDKNQNPFNNPDKEVFHLDTNYRSYSQIIDFNNSFFKKIASEFVHIDYQDLYENHSTQKPNSKNGGYVNITFIPKSEDLEWIDDAPVDKEMIYVLETFDKIKFIKNQGFEYKDIAILTRKRSQGIAIANYLIEQNIPIISSETLMIGHAGEVKLIINFLKYLKNKNDKISKANFLEYLAQNCQDKLEIHDFIYNGMQFDAEQEFENWLVDFGFAINFENIRKKSLYETVEQIINWFINQKNNTAYLQYFLDIILERDMKYQLGIADFLEYWDKNQAKFSIPSPEGTNAVQIMTIHKSKGLEFPVVIFPFADEDYNHKPKEKLWLDAADEVFGLPRVLIDNSKAVEGFGNDAKEVYDNKKQEELLDNINVLYVALTRAEEQLYIISSMNLDKDNEPRLNQMSSFFINYLNQNGGFDNTKLEYEFGNPKKISITEKHIDNNKKIETVVNLFDTNDIKIAQRESAMWGSERQKSIEFGTVLHEILSYINTKNDIELAITKAVENGLITLKQTPEIRKSIVDIVNHPQLIDFFDADKLILNEKTIIQKGNKTIKPDRMVFDKKNVFLLDYKTGNYELKHKQQLENYQIGIESMGFKVLKMSLIYIGNEIEVLEL